MKTVAGIDPGVRKTAVVFIEENGHTYYRTFKVKKNAGKRRLEPALHWAMVSQVADAVKAAGPVIIAIEEPFMGRGAASGLLQYGVFASIVFELFPSFAGELRLVAPMTLKKFVGVSGKKDLMVREVYRRWKFDNDDTDVVDAFAIAKWGMETLTGG